VCSSDLDHEFWAVIFQDEQSEDIDRYDLSPEEIADLKKVEGNFYNIWREFETTIRPHKWIVWPYDRETGWCEMVSGPLPRV
jgi:hypothetical protein